MSAPRTRSERLHEAEQAAVAVRRYLIELATMGHGPISITINVAADGTPRAMEATLHTGPQGSWHLPLVARPTP